MRILIYLPWVSKKWGGVYQYSLGVLETLSKDKKNVYYILNEGEDEVIQSVINDSTNFVLVKPKDVLSPRLGKRILRLVNKLCLRLSPKLSFDAVGELDQFLINNKIDIAYSTFQASPPVRKIRSICTMHDVQELHFPEFFTSTERMNRAINYKNAIDNSDAIIVSFEHVKKDIVKYFQKRSEAIFICLFDVSNLWFNKLSKSDLKKIEDLSPYESYILYPAATWEHKNHVNLLKAVALANKKNENKIKLVCTGNKTSFYFSVLEPLINELGIKEDVIFLGIVDEKSLFTLYHYANAVVIPTLYEAGSFPLFESIILNVPVVSSNVTSLPETIDNESFVFSPTDVNDIAEKIIKISYDSDFRQKCIENNERRKKELFKNNFMENLTNVFEKVNIMNKNW